MRKIAPLILLIPLFLSGCPNPGSPDVIIYYHQTGACNGGQGQSGDPSTFYAAGDGQSYVLFGIDEIDASQITGSSFAFDPTKLFVNSQIQDFVDPNLMIYHWVLFDGIASQAQNIPPGQVINFNPSGQNALIVQTANQSDPAAEANATNYNLLYNTNVGPGVVMMKTNTIPPIVPNEDDCGVLGQHLF